MGTLLQALQAERESLTRRLAAVDMLIGSYGSAPVRGRPAAASPRTRSGAKPPRSGSLKEHLLSALKGEMGPSDLAAAVRKGGFKSKNKTLEKSVGIALAQLARAGHVRKTGRGRFAPA